MEFEGRRRAAVQSLSTHGCSSSRAADAHPGHAHTDEGVHVKLGFWSLFDVDWTNEEIARRAATLGYDGVDLRVAAPGSSPRVGDNLSLDSSIEETARTQQAFAQTGVEISGLNCYNSSPSRGDAAAFDTTRT